MKLVLSLMFLINCSIAYAQVTYDEFSKTYDKAMSVVMEEETSQLKGDYKSTFINEFKKIFLNEKSKKFMFDGFEKNYLSTYIKAENFGATYATMLRIEGAKRLNLAMQRQQTAYSRQVLDYANAKECSALVKNKGIRRSDGMRGGVELYAMLPYKDYKNYFETNTRSAMYIFNGKDESYAVNDAELSELNKLFIGSLKEQLTEKKLALFSNVIQNTFDKSSDEDVCEVGKMLLDTILNAGTQKQSEKLVNAWIKGRLLKN